MRILIGVPCDSGERAAAKNAQLRAMVKGDHVFTIGAGRKLECKRDDARPHDPRSASS